MCKIQNFCIVWSTLISDSKDDNIHKLKKSDGQTHIDKCEVAAHKITKFSFNSKDENQNT